MHTHLHINYIELQSTDLAASKAFFHRVFGWTFTDYGPDYSSFSNGALGGGFYRSTKAARIDDGAVLLVIYSNELLDTQAAVEQAGGTLSKPIFTFPGGKRFHFIEPGGNELAVWSEH